MILSLRYRRLFFFVAIVAACGCTVINTGDALTSDKLLKAASPSSEATPVDIYWANLDAADSGSADNGEDGGEALWRLIEETRLPAELRRRLASNGLRVGVVGGALPDDLLELLNPENNEAANAENEAAGVQSLESTGVSRATYSLTPGRRVDVQAGPTIDSTAVLLSSDGVLTAGTFEQAQPTYVLEMEAKEGQSTRLRITPELRHGEQRLRFAPDSNGVISRASMTRDTEAFPELAVEVTLAPGETLVVTSTPGADGRLGGCFHRESEDSPTRRAMLIRAAAASRDDAFDR